MKQMIKKVIAFLIGIVLGCNLVWAKSFETISSSENELLYNPKYEFRAAWIASVHNIDWPSQSGLDESTQKREYIELLDSLEDVGINAVIVQIRPAADALYCSESEPWSAYLTGVQGEAVKYDPLAFMIEEAHLRGMEFHAWLNPFRITTAGVSKEGLAANNIAYTHPDWVVSYGDKLLLNPSIPEVREYIIQVIAEIVKNYKVDAIHFDDYFYPYPDKEHTVFPDEEQFNEYGWMFNQIEDFRRNNINELIRGIDVKIASINPKVKFGISPFGVWANKEEIKKGSRTHAGVTSYGTLYADTKYWLERGWIDYIIPQLYWKFEAPSTPYHVLVDWWSKLVENKNTHLYIGQAIYKLKEDKTWTSREILNQITYNRTKDRVKGSSFFSANSLQSNSEHISTTLKNYYYCSKALIPPMTWLPGSLPTMPQAGQAIIQEKKVKLTWVDETPESTDYYVIYKFNQGEDNIHDPNHILEIIYNEDTLKQDKEFIDTSWDEAEIAYRITSFSRSKGESIPSERITVIK